MNEVNHWEEFKLHMATHYPDHGYNSPLIFTFGLSSKISEVFEITQHELKTNQTNEAGRLKALKKVFSYIAYLEIFFDFPGSPYTQFFGTKFEGLNYDMNLLEIQGEVNAHMSALSTAMVDMDNDVIQYSLNKVIMCMFDVCCIYGVDTTDIVTIKEVETKAVTESKPYDYSKDTKEGRKAIRKSGSIEALIEIKHDKRSKITYRGVSVKIDGQTKTFHRGDVITDFFSISNYTAEALKGRKYKLNFGPKFRRLITANPAVIYMGYIMAAKRPFIKTAAEIRKESNTEGATQDVDKDKGRPVLLAPHINTFDKLQDHVMETRKNFKKLERVN